MDLYDRTPQFAVPKSVLYIDWEFLLPFCSWDALLEFGSSECPSGPVNKGWSLTYGPIL